MYRPKVVFFGHAVGPGARAPKRRGGSHKLHRRGRPRRRTDGIPVRAGATAGARRQSGDQRQAELRSKVGACHRRRRDRCFGPVT